MCLQGGLRSSQYTKSAAPKTSAPKGLMNHVGSILLLAIHEEGISRKAENTLGNTPELGFRTAWKENETATHIKKNQ